MTEPPGLRHPLGIEAVHWSRGAGIDLVVRVAGRWRRRTAMTVPPVLVIDTENRRYRFPALPEPPSVRGSQPGLWQVGFTIPASLAPYLSGRLTLVLGSVSIPLPPAVADTEEPSLPDRVEETVPVSTEQAVLAERRKRDAALVERQVQRRADEAEAAAREAQAAAREVGARVERLELEVAEARGETARLEAALERAQRRRREAEQFAHSEAALRLELEREYGTRIGRQQTDARVVLELLEAVQIHARELEREVETLRRAADEAGEPVWDRSPSQPRPGLDRAGQPSGQRARVLAAELIIANSIPPAPVPVAPSTLGAPSGLGLELAMLGFTHAARLEEPIPHGNRPPLAHGSAFVAADAVIRKLRDELEHEQSARARLESELAKAEWRVAAERAQADELAVRGLLVEHELAEGRARAAYMLEAIEGIGRQLDAVRMAAGRPTAARGEVAEEDAGPPARRANRGVGEHPDPPAAPSGRIAPDRLAAARYRLREESSPPEAEPDPADPDGVAVPRPELAPTPEPELELAATPEPELELAATPEPEPEPAATPAPEPELAATPEPELAGAPEPGAATPTTEAEPAAPTPVPEPESGAATPVPESEAAAATPEPAATPAATPDPGGALEPEPAAATPEPAALPTQPARWLRRTMKNLLREDAATAGSVVVHLLPAQRLVGGPIRYDLALGDAGCFAVTALEGEFRVERLDEPRPLGAVGFRVEGDLAGLGRLLVYGALRRRLSRRVASVRGDRRAIRALDALIREPLSLHELYAAGVRLDPELTLEVVAHMIDPSWTAGERFTIGHESRAGGGRTYLLVRDGERPRVSSQPSLGPVASTILCPSEELLALLAGGSGSDATVRGATAPIALLREWIVRAEHGS